MMPRPSLLGLSTADVSLRTHGRSFAAAVLIALAATLAGCSGESDSSASSEDPAQSEEAYSSACNSYADNKWPNEFEACLDVHGTKLLVDWVSAEIHVQDEKWPHIMPGANPSRGMASFEVTQRDGRVVYRTGQVAGELTQPSSNWDGYEWYFRLNVKRSFQDGSKMCVTLTMPEGYTFGTSHARTSRRCATIHA